MGPEPFQRHRHLGELKHDDAEPGDEDGTMVFEGSMSGG
jgi:hypothetical protein